ncbi:ComF family protein [Larkinella insperata]|uniref:ComF family protein n=1 Tax=Larkinella insperata TaxID=332158 RepID=A0ABW3Q6L1_9BACT|nr:ComF family protein [Larkinella insperata]
MIGKLIVSGFQDLLNLFYPNPCLLCQDSLQQSEEIICTACRLQLPETGQHRGEALIDGQTKFAGKVPVEFVYAYLYFTKRGKTQRLIHALKYRGNKEVGNLLGRWYGNQLKTDIHLNDHIDLIVGVPLHPAKLRQRGYNQSDWIAQGLSQALDIPWSDRILTRNRNTISQTGKDRMGRWENVSNVFQISDPDLVTNKRILLVDDVLTTGATLEACTAALLASNSQSVGIITAAATR